MEYQLLAYTHTSINNSNKTRNKLRNGVQTRYPITLNIWVL